MKELILENQNLIYALANYFKNYSNKDELFQVGCIGMINAYNNYDESKGAKFTTYAVPYILGEMKKHIREDNAFKVSQNLSRLYFKIDKTQALLTQQLMREPTTLEIASFLELPESMVADALSYKVTVSFDEPLTDEGKEITLKDVIGMSDDIDSLIDLREALSCLEQQEQDVINSRYINDLTQQQTADLLGMSQVQVYRKEQKILTKLKDKLAA